MKAMLKVEKFNKDWRITQLQKQRSESFLMGFVETLYTMFYGLAYNPPVTALNGFGLASINRSPMALNLAGRGLDNIHNKLYNGESATLPIGLPIGIVCGGGDDAVTANGPGLADPITPAFFTNDYSKPFAWSLLWNMPASFVRGMTYDPDTDEILYPDDSVNPLVIKAISPVDGSAIRDIVTDIVTGPAVISSIRDVEVTANYYFVSYRSAADAYTYTIRVNKATGVTIDYFRTVNDAYGSGYHSLCKVVVGGVTFIGYRTYSTGTHQLNFKEEVTLVSTFSNRSTGFLDASYWQAGCPLTILPGSGAGFYLTPSGFLNRIVSATGSTSSDDLTMAYRTIAGAGFPGPVITDFKGMAGNHPKYVWAVYYDGTYNRVMRKHIESNLLHGAVRMSWPSNDAVGGEFDLVSDITNTGITDVTIKELGIVAPHENGRASLIARDVLGAPVTIAGGETLRVTYTIAAAV